VQIIVSLRVDFHIRVAIARQVAYLGWQLLYVLGRRNVRMGGDVASRGIW